ncbi:hypothetical protein M407DRAFT_246538 [Tulasnella calospora MUT 4182]|uniref:Uncharacterized protein n=1 Tax=Tulasnella calospora MUT 4182 TaxID=1051891 RepID=A0A0C3Q4H6_9AGAM|nr:hypothetical protein M407DRAFT_246538 [Tulasnella calospora MUT 4182]
MHPSSRALSKILPRAAVPESSIIAPMALPTISRAKQPTVIDKLLAKKKTAMEAGRPYPQNLRLETFQDVRASWQGIGKDLRRELKLLAREK